jgi:hypothetical protein
MTQIALCFTGLVLIAMGAVCVRFARDVQSGISRTLMRTYVYLFGLLMAGLGASIGAMGGGYAGTGLTITVVGLVAFGLSMLFFPGRFIALVEAMLGSLPMGGRAALALANALLGFACGAALLFLVWRDVPFLHAL